jgi:NADH-quinone oxidoreductase subunit L
MVTSGLYLICRLNIVFSFSPFAMMVVAIVGALTALFAATIGLVQNDIKKVLAYSTVSQLGFMFLGVGVGAFGMGFFHVFTHAFFKACLFLGAGSVIHAMHARIHDDVKSQDMRFMGGLKKFMPWTYVSMGVATLAISGFPLTSGFFSKDGILFHAYANKVVHPYVDAANARIAALSATPGHEKEITALQNMAAQYFHAPTWLGPVLFGIGVVAATCTSFYMFRLLFKTFWGDFRGWAIDPGAPLATDPLKNEEELEVGDTGYGLALTHSAHSAHGGAEHESADPHDVLEGEHFKGDDHDAHGHHGDHDHHHEEDLTKPAAPPAEAPWTMAFPVAILGAFALLAGFLWAEPLHLEALGEWLAPVFHETVGHNITTHASKALEMGLMVPGILACFIGLGLAYQWYVKDEEKTPARLAAEWPRLHRAAYNKWYVDEIYDATVIGGTDALADGAALMDTWIVDGILAKLTALLVSAFGSILRAFQTGVVHVYGGILAIGTLALVVFFVRPHAEATVAKDGSSFVVEAAPGIGYEYKWAVDGKEEPSFVAGDSAMKRQVQVAEGASSTVVLEVRNSFGRTAKHTFTLSNPKPEPAGLPVGATPGVPQPRPAGH